MDDKMIKLNNATLQPEPTLEVMIETTMPEAMDYVADKVFPRVESKTLNGYFGRVDESSQSIMNTVVKGLAKNFVNYKFDRNATFEVVDHEISNVITAADAERLGGWDVAKEIINMELRDAVLKSREHALASALFNTTTFASYTTALSGATCWSDTTSDVLANAYTAKTSIATATGKICNTVIMGYATFAVLQKHPQIYAVLWPGKSETPALISEAQLALALGVDRIIVGRATYNSAKEGQTGVPAFVWGDYCMFAYIAPSGAARFSKTLGAQIVCPSKAPETYVGSYIPEGKMPNQVQVLTQGANYGDKLITVGAGYLFSNTVA